METVKEKIISETICLIENRGGNADQITTRAIARQANVGVGLINYHFGTKERLIALCVQQIISGVIYAFQPQLDEGMPVWMQLAERAIQVYDFLFEHAAVCRISILADLQTPQPMDNTQKTMHGLSKTAQCEPTDVRLFALVAAMQSAFLKRETGTCYIEYDLQVKAERDQFLRDVVASLWGQKGD